MILTLFDPSEGGCVVSTSIVYIFVHRLLFYELVTSHFDVIYKFIYANAFVSIPYTYLLYNKKMFIWVYKRNIYIMMKDVPYADRCAHAQLTR